LAKDKLTKDEKAIELTKYRGLVIATLDYYLENTQMMIKTADLDSSEHFKSLKLQTNEHFEKGKLNKLKQWFRDLTEPQVENGDIKLNKYLQDKTGFDTDIFNSYFRRVDKIIEKGKITSDNQFYDINIMVNQLCQIEPVDNEKIEILNKLLGDYEKRKSQKSKRKKSSFAR
jgi:hypothetical protein